MGSFFPAMFHCEYLAAAETNFKLSTAYVAVKNINTQPSRVTRFYFSEEKRYAQRCKQEFVEVPQKLTVKTDMEDAPIARNDSGIDVYQQVYIFAANYIIMIIIGYDIVGGYAWRFIYGEYTEALILFQSEIDKETYDFIWAATSPTIMPVVLSLVIFILFASAFFLFGRFGVDITASVQLFVLVSSQWVVFVIYFLCALAAYYKGDGGPAFKDTVAYAFCYSILPIFTSGLFWCFPASRRFLILRA